MNYISETDIDKITSETAKRLSKEPKKTIVIRSEGNEYWEGGINGHFFRIKTDVEVSVPESLAKLIAQSATLREQSEQAVSAFRNSAKKLG